MLVTDDVADALTALEARASAPLPSYQADLAQRKISFMFTGQGAQYINMGRGLYETEATFRQQVDKCVTLLKPALGLNLRDVLCPQPEQLAAAEQQLSQTALTQPALFIIEYALARLWMEWGIMPQSMIGHSIGEYVAACLAGVFSLPAALELVVARGRLMQALPPGAMLAVSLPAAEVEPLLGATFRWLLIMVRRCALFPAHSPPSLNWRRSWPSAVMIAAGCIPHTPSIRR